MSLASGNLGSDIQIVRLQRPLMFLGNVRDLEVS